MQPLTVSFIKFFHYLMTPLGILLVTILLYWASKLFSLKKIASILLFQFFFLFWFFSAPVSVHWLDNQMISASASEDLQKTNNLSYDTIMVAGWQKAFMEGDINMDRFWSQRLWVAAQEHKKTGRPIVVISSQYPVPEPPAPGEQPYAVNKLLEWGVERDNIINAQPGQTTFEGISNGYHHLTNLGSQNILMVGYRGRVARKKKVLEALFATESNTKGKQVYVRSITAGHQHNRPNPFRLKSWLPNGKSFNYSAGLTHEIAGHIAYRLLGWFSK